MSFLPLAHSDGTIRAYKPAPAISAAGFAASSTFCPTTKAPHPQLVSLDTIDEVALPPHIVDTGREEGVHQHCLMHGGFFNENLPWIIAHGLRRAATGCVTRVDTASCRIPTQRLHPSIMSDPCICLASLGYPADKPSEVAFLILPPAHIGH